GRELAEQMGGRESAELLSAVQQVASVSTQLQETVMDIRMLPIRHVFERFPRLVRDLARQQGKDIELILEGEGTRIDKAIIDEIGEPLVHMIRNSVDHGIETPAIRVARGKTPTATILLSAMQETNHVLITLIDDGHGIISARLVEVSDRTYAVPLGSVIESLKFRPADVHTINGRDTLRIRDRIVPLVRLAAFFGLRAATEEARYAVVLGRGDKRVALVV